MEREIINCRRLVVTPLKSELKYLCNAFSQLGYDSTARNIGKLEVLEYPELQLFTAPGGHGKIQYALHTQYLLDRTNTEVLICAGAAGALAPNIAIGDIIVGTHTVEHDYYEKFSDQPQPHPQYRGDECSIATLRSLGLNDENLQVHFGIIASGDEDIVELTRANELHDLHGALAVAWEGAGGGRASAFNGVPYLEIRGATDTADHMAPNAFSINLELAMQNIARLLARFCRV